MRKKLEEELELLGEDARICIESQYGSISYGRQDLDKALDYFAQEGIRLLLCKNIYDKGRLVAGNIFAKEPANASC